MIDTKKLTTQAGCPVDLTKVWPKRDYPLTPVGEFEQASSHCQPPEGRSLQRCRGGQSPGLGGG